MMISLYTIQGFSWQESEWDKFHFMEQHLKIIDEIVESSKYFR